MDYTAAAIVLFCVIVGTGLLRVLKIQERTEAKLDALIKGLSESVPDLRINGKAIMPKVRDGMQMMELAVKALVAVAGRAVKKRKAKIKGNVPVVPIVDEAEFRRFCRELLAEVKESDDIASVPVTESYWKSKGWGREQFVAFRDRLERAGVIRVIDRRGTRGWMQTPKGYAGAVKRLEELCKH